MRVLIDRAGTAPQTTSDVTDAQLARLYAVPGGPWLRVNFVSSADGAATGADGRSGSINNAADKRVFDLLRAQADAIVVGAGTASVEGYRPPGKPVVVVTNRGTVPPTLAEAPRGELLVATHAASPGLAAVRDAVGEEQVLVCGEHTLDLVELKAALAGRGLRSLLSEGGPTLFGHMLAEDGVVDEACVTTVPRLVAGAHIRIARGLPVDRALRLQVLLEEEDTLLQRWLVG